MGDFIIHDGTNNDLIYPSGFGRGLVQRDFAVQPMRALPSEIPMVPRSEWDARIDEQEARQSSLEHIRLTGNNGQMIPSLDQNGQGFCHTADTEVLTERGWVEWPEYNWTDMLATVNQRNGAMEFQLPFQKHEYNYDGEMVYSTNRRCDFGVTPDHRMMVRKWDESKRTLSDQYTFQTAGQIGWYAGLMNAPRGWIGTDLVEVEIPGDRRYDGDDFMALISLIVSDGFAGSYKHSGNLVSFASFRPECRDRVAALAQRVGFKEQPSRPGVWNRWGADALGKWLFANCYTGGGFEAQHKRIPDIVKCASRRQIEHFLTWNGDQNHNRDAHGEHYYSASKRMVDDLQELCLRVGRRGTIMHRKSRTRMMPQGSLSTSRECWELHVSGTDRLCIDRKKHIERERYRGPVYCAAVPNQTLITRRNGSVLISGNCWAYSTTMAVMLVRAVNNQPYVRLSGHAIGCKVKNFQDEGGWAALSEQFHREHGCPSVDHWQEKSMSRSNDTPATWANASKHRVTEDFADLTASVYDQNLTVDQIASCLLHNIPVAVDYNEWSHSICAIRWVRIERGSYGPKILNSWTDQWGDRGMGVIQRGWTVDGAVAIGVTGGTQV